jgi:hypothetical protein
MIPAHPSPDPPPARPLFIEARDAASDAEAGAGFDAGFGDGDGAAGGAGGAGGAGAGAGGGVGADAGASRGGGASDGGVTPSIVGADRVIAGLRPRFRNCYQQGLASDRKMRGRVVLSASVSAKGDVVAVTPTQVDGMSANVVTCLVSVMKKATFTAPGGAGSSLQVPVVFRQ